MKIENEKLKPIIDSMEREYRQNMLTILDRFYRGRGGSLLTKDEREAMEYAISSIKTDLKYDLLYEETKHIADADKMIAPTPKNNVPENNVGKIEPVIRDNEVENELNRVKNELEPRKITLEDVKGYCKPRCLTIISNELLYELTHPKIKAPEQEPVIDKLRAEIEEPLKINQGLNTESAKAQAIALSWVLEVIDKYKAESEG